MLDDRWLRAAIDSALRKRLVSFQALSRLAKRGKRGCAGTVRLRQLSLEYCDRAEVSDSALESFAIELTRVLKVRPLLHHRIFRDRLFIAEVDLAWPKERLCVELDGWRHHGSQEAFARDRTRDRKLVSFGWTVLRYSWSEIARSPERVASELTRWLERAA